MLKHMSVLLFVSFYASNIFKAVLFQACNTTLCKISCFNALKTLHHLRQGKPSGLQESCTGELSWISGIQAGRMGKRGLEWPSLCLGGRKQKSGLKRGGLNHTLEVVLTRHSHSGPSESQSSYAPLFSWGKMRTRLTPRALVCTSVSGRVLSDAATPHKSPFSTSCSV